MNFVASGRLPVPALREQFKQYLKAFGSSKDRSLAGRDEPLYGSSKHLYLAPTDEEAVERTRTGYEAYRNHFLKPLPGGRVDPEEIPRPANYDVETAFQTEDFVAGSPATVREYVRRYAGETGANYFVGSFHWGDLTHEEASRSLQLFASEVMPAFL